MRTFHPIFVSPALLATLVMMAGCPQGSYDPLPAATSSTTTEEPATTAAGEPTTGEPTTGEPTTGVTTGEPTTKGEEGTSTGTSTGADTAATTLTPDPRCEPGETKACYSGPVGTEDIGLCHGGIQTCEANGLGFGPCVGEVLPATETCGANRQQPNDDANCDGIDLCSGKAQWARAFGEVPRQPDDFDQQVYSLAVDQVGATLFGGGFRSNLQVGEDALWSKFPGFLYSAYIAKVSDGGEPLWAMAVTEAADAMEAGQLFVGTVQTDLDDNVYAVGSANQHAVKIGNTTVGVDSLSKADTLLFVAKLDSMGEVQHTLAIRAGGDGGLNDVKVDDEGQPWILARFTGQAELLGQAFLAKGSDQQALLVARLSKDLSQIEASQVIFAGKSQAYGYLAINENGVYVAGSFQDKLEVAGKQLLAQGTDGFVARLGLDGEGLSLVHHLSGAGEQRVQGFHAGESGKLALGGTFDKLIAVGAQQLESKGYLDAFLFALDEQAAPIWSRGYGDNNKEAKAQQITRVFVDGAEQLHAIINYNGSLSMDGKVFMAPVGADLVAKFDSLGQVQWTQGYSDTQASLTDLAVDKQGYMRLGGNFTGSLNLKIPDEQPLYSGSESDRDLFIAKLKP